MSVLESRNPSTGELVGTVEATPTSTIAAIVDRARGACPGWRELGIDGRAQLIGKAAQAMLDAEEPIAELISREMGKPVREGAAEVRACASTLATELAEISEALAPEILSDERTTSTIYRDPLGVCAAITPWNFPFSMPHWMIFPALAAGNTVVFKPSEETPLVGQAYFDILAPLLPEGVLQIVHGDDEQGKALVATDIDLIAFTGSRETGKRIMAKAADSLKRVILELGGKDPLVVLEDADLDKAARFAAQNSFRNAGQVCVSTERIFVPTTIADEFVSRLASATAEMTVGDGLDQSTKVGPMINRRQKDHVVAQVDDAIRQGAQVVLGHEPMDGNFVAPTILRGVTDDMSIARDETFGPVACVSVVADADQAVRGANSGRFGLGAVVFGGDTIRTHEVARKLQAGMIGINRGVGGAQGSPWVGARESGYGYHGSRDGHRQFTQTRVVSSSKST